MILLAACAALWLAVLITRPTRPPFAGEQGDLMLAHERRRHGYAALLAGLLTAVLLWLALVSTATAYNSDFARIRGDGCMGGEVCWMLDDDNHWYLRHT